MKVKELKGHPPSILILRSNIHKKKINRFNSLSIKTTKEMGDLVVSMNKICKAMLYSPHNIDYQSINYLSKKGLNTTLLLKNSIRNSNNIIRSYENEDFLEQDLYVPDYLKEIKNNKKRVKSEGNIEKKNIYNKKEENINESINFDLKKYIDKKSKRKVKKLLKYHEKLKKLKKLDILKAEIIRNEQRKKYTLFKSFEKPMSREGLSFYRNEAKTYTGIQSKYLEYNKTFKKRNKEITLNSLNSTNGNPTKIDYNKTNKNIAINLIDKENKNSYHHKNKSSEIFQNTQVSTTLNSTTNNSLNSISKNNNNNYSKKRPLTSNYITNRNNFLKYKQNYHKNKLNNIMTNINNIEDKAKKESDLFEKDCKDDNKYNQEKKKRKTKSYDFEKVKKEKNSFINKINSEFNFTKSKENNNDIIMDEHELAKKNAKKVLEFLDDKGKDILKRIINKMIYDDNRLHKKFIMDSVYERKLFKIRTYKEFSLVAQESLFLDKQLKDEEKDNEQEEKEVMHILRDILQMKYDNENDLRESILRCNVLKRVQLYEDRAQRETGHFFREKFKENIEDPSYYKNKEIKKKRKSKSYNINSKYNNDDMNDAHDYKNYNNFINNNYDNH